MTISTAKAFDKDTQLAASRDKDGHSHIYGNPDNSGKQRMINLGTIGDRDGHRVKGWVSGLSGHNHLPCGHHTGETQLIDLHPFHTNELYGQTDPRLGKGSQHHTASCLNMTGNNRVNARSTPGGRVNYMQKDLLNDMGSNQNRLYNDTTDTTGNQASPALTLARYIPTMRLIPGWLIYGRLTILRVMLIAIIIIG